MEFFSSRLVSHEFVDRLSADIRRASVCRFLVAYVNHGGINAIGRNELRKVLSNSDSFGVASLSCACSYEPLMRLQKELGEKTRLKYFMDPMAKGGEGSESDLPIALLHSKLVYLHLSKTNTSVVYIGSHNWTRRALGKRTPRNAEASMRIEMPFEPCHLTGDGTTVVHQVNQHLKAAFENKACFPATRDNLAQFEQWYDIGCSRKRQSELDELTVIVAVRTLPDTKIDHKVWSGLKGNGIYLQVLDPEDGDRIRAANKRLLVLVWQSLEDFKKSRQPIILKCHDSTQNSGPNSNVTTTNRAKNPIVSFRAVLFDRVEASGKKNLGLAPQRSVAPTRLGKHFYYYEMEIPTKHQTAEEVDRGLALADQFRLEVEDVIFPLDMQGDEIQLPKVWAPSSLAFASSKNDATAEKPPGYLVPEQRVQEILKTFADDFGIPEDKLKVKPVSKFDDVRMGLRIAIHPLHDTYIADIADQRQDEFYGAVKKGWLAAETDRKKINEKSLEQPKTQPRTQRVFTTEWSLLNELWSSGQKHSRENRTNDTELS